MTIEHVLLRDDHCHGMFVPVLMKTATQDSEGFVLGVCDAAGDQGVYNIFYGNEMSRSVDCDVTDCSSYAACLTFMESDKDVLAKQLRELADLVESM